MIEYNYEAVAELFKVFGDETRIKLMTVLLHGEMPVGELASFLDMTQSAISHQLKVLKQSKLVKTRREGKSIYYSLDDDHVYDILKCGIDHINED